MTEQTKAEMKNEVESLREKVRELEALQLRIFAAFTCADATLRHRYTEDLRGETSKQEAAALLLYVAGYEVKP